MTATEKRWVPLESNPELLTKYSHGLGLEKGEWLDVFALDDESLDTIPGPVVAVMLLFPISEKYDKESETEDATLKEKGQEVSSNLVYLKQTVRNACGTYGLVHALANAGIKLKENGVLQQFINETKGLSPEERGEALGNNKTVAELHQAIAEMGQTAAPDAQESLEPHFVALIHKDGHLYELDGRRQGPVNRGSTTPEKLLKDAAKVCKERMARDPNEYRFTVMALTTAL